VDLKDILRKRYSVRGYAHTPVSDDVINKLFELVRYAPSACNNQPWVFIVVRDLVSRSNLNKAYERQWFKDAPVVIAAGYDKVTSWKRSDGRDYGAVDIAIAMDHLTLAAADLGLGTCWIAAFNDTIARSALGIPDTIELVALTPIGYSTTTSTEKKRNPTDAFVHWEHFGGKNVKMKRE